MTWQPSSKVLAAALAHAAQCAPLEGCGVVINGDFYPVLNRSTRWDAFCMDVPSLIKLEADVGRPEAIVHSHVYVLPIASEADKTACERTALPWLIVSWPKGSHSVIEPSGFEPPLVGRQWAWQYGDCYALVRDGFKAYTGITLPDFRRDWDWWNKGEDIITEMFGTGGFVSLGQKVEPQHCDVIGMQVMAPVVNHLGLFLAPDILLHHMMGRLSTRVIYGGLYRKTTRYVLRHRDLMEAP